MAQSPHPANRPFRSGQRRLQAWVWLVPLALYLTLTLYQLGLPGPNYDEAVEAKPAVQFLQHLPVEAHRNAVIHLLGRPLPLMVVDYVGALNVWALIGLFKVAGISVPVMRLWPVAVGGVILWLTWLLGKRLFGPRAGFMAAMLLAVQPSFVFFARQGIYVTNTTIALMLGIWLALLQLMTTGRARWLALAAFMAGLGLWAKFIMLWPLAATAVVWPLVWWQRERLGLVLAEGFRARSLLQPRFWAPAAGLFLLGLSPFILFNLKTGATFKHFANTLNRSYYGVENAAYLDNLMERVSQMRHVLLGDHFWYLGGNFADTLALPAFLLALAFILAGLGWRRQATLAWRGLFLLLFLLLIFLQSPLTPTALWYTHLAMFSPLLSLVIAAGWELPLRALPPRWGRIAAGGLLLALLFSGLRADVGYHRALTSTGGYADHSDAVYRLTDELLARGIYSPYALDWGFEAPIILISRGQINPVEIFGYEPYDRPDDAFADRVRPLLQNPDAFFLVHDPARTNFRGRSEALQAVAEELGLRLETVAVIRERSGAPHSEIWRAAPPDAP